MADLASASVKINNVEVSSDAPISEALMAKIGADANAMIDDSATQAARISLLETGAGLQVLSGSNIAYNTPCFSVTVTIDSNDFISIRFNGANTSPFVNAASFTASAAFVGGNFQLKRGSTVLQDLAIAPSGNSNIASGATFYDRPGAGTFTYTLVMVGSTAGYVYNPTGIVDFRTARV